jgi:NTP pyrophosphatase (non-canonical NTP hydrolase)
MDVNEFDERVFMDFSQYQFRTGLTARYPQDRAIEYLVLGLTSEAGEVAGKYKKIIRDNDGQFTQENTDALLDELGDVLWYCSELATVLKTNLAAVAARNVQKLESRAQRGKIGGSGDKR